LTGNQYYLFISLKGPRDLSGFYSPDEFKKKDTKNFDLGIEPNTD
jgi:hypothetical protein